MTVRSSKRASRLPPLELELRLRLRRGDEVAMGPGKAELLTGIETTGSISAAARAMGMSYMRAWSLVKTMNGCFPGPLVETSRGGRLGGVARVTPLGRQVLKVYHRAVAAAERAGRSTLLKSRH